MITHPSLLEKAPTDEKRRQALAKVYELLIKLAEEEEKKAADATQIEENSALLKSNIPS